MSRVQETARLRRLSATQTSVASLNAEALELGNWLRMPEPTLSGRDEDLKSLCTAMFKASRSSATDWPTLSDKLLDANQKVMEAWLLHPSDASPGQRARDVLQAVTEIAVQTGGWAMAPDKYEEFGVTGSM